jgi:hypothetical protein
LSEYLFFLTKTGNPALVKRGLQGFAWQIEQGKLLTPRFYDRLLAAFPAFLADADEYVRRWAYVLLCFLGLPRDHPMHPSITAALLTALVDREQDAENRTWACAGLFTVCGEEHARRELRAKPLELSGNQIMLCALLASQSTTVLTDPSAYKPLIDGDPMVARWIALLFGYHRTAEQRGNEVQISKDFITSLTAHNHHIVAEYAIWSLTYTADGSYKNLARPPHAYLSAEPNVRRWLYQLLAKTYHSARDNQDLLRDAMLTERAPNAREGLALALSKRYDRGDFSRDLIGWYMRERETLLKLPLVSHFARFREKNRDYEEIIQEELEQNMEVFRQNIAAYSRHYDQYMFLDRQLQRLRADAGTPIQTTLPFDKGGIVYIMSIENKPTFSGPVYAYGSNFGVALNSTMEAISGIDANKTLAESRRKEIQELLRLLATRVDSLDEMETDTKREALEYIQEFAKQTAESKEPSVLTKTLRAVRGLFTEVASSAPAVGAVIELVDKIRGLIAG